MIRKSSVLCMLSLALFFVWMQGSAFAAEGINRQIPFYGSLYDAEGAPITSSFDVRFALYTTPTGGTPEWSATYLVTVTNGAFSVMLGEGEGNELALTFADDSHYLGITIEDDSEMTPRERLGAAPYAFNTDLLDGLHASSFMRSDNLFTLSTSSEDSLLTLTQSGTGDYLTLLNGVSADPLFSVLNSGRVAASSFEGLLDEVSTFAGSLSVQSDDMSYFNSSVSLGDGAGISFGNENGLLMYQDTSSLGFNDLMLIPQGEGLSNGYVQITTPGALWFASNNADGCSFGCEPAFKLSETGGAEIYNTNFGDEANRYFDVNFTSGMHITSGDLQILNGNLSAAGTINGANLIIDGLGTLSDLTVGGLTSITDLGVSGMATVGDFAANGGVSAATLTISGLSTMETLTVDTDATIGNLSVAGTATITDLDLNGTVSDLDVLGTVRVQSLAGNGVVSLSVDNDGNIITDAPSDKALKKNIEEIDDALDMILALRGVRYGWKDENRFGSQTEVGFIAQEVQEVVPEVVRDNGEYLSLNTKNIVAVVVEALKELHSKVAEYFDRTEALEREVDILRAEIELLKEENTFSGKGPFEEELSNELEAEDVLEPVADLEETLIETTPEESEEEEQTSEIETEEVITEV